MVLDVRYHSPDVMSVGAIKSDTPRVDSYAPLMIELSCDAFKLSC